MISSLHFFSKQRDEWRHPTVRYGVHNTARYATAGHLTAFIPAGRHWSSLHRVLQTAASGCPQSSRMQRWQDTSVCVCVCGEETSAGHVRAVLVCVCVCVCVCVGEETSAVWAVLLVHVSCAPGGGGAAPGGARLQASCQCVSQTHVVSACPRVHVCVKTNGVFTSIKYWSIVWNEVKWKMRILSSHTYLMRCICCK